MWEINDQLNIPRIYILNLDSIRLDQHFSILGKYKTHKSQGGWAGGMCEALCSHLGTEEKYELKIFKVQQCL